MWILGNRSGVFGAYTKKIATKLWSSLCVPTCINSIHDLFETLAAFDFFSLAPRLFLGTVAPK
jgi:hypothetical protein